MPDDRNSARQQRLRAALRENLKRRKGQLRGRTAAADREIDSPAESSDPAHDQQDTGDAPPKSRADG